MCFQCLATVDSIEMVPAKESCAFDSPVEKKWSTRALQNLANFQIGLPTEKGYNFEVTAGHPIIVDAVALELMKAMQPAQERRARARHTRKIIARAQAGRARAAQNTPQTD